MTMTSIFDSYRDDMTPEEFAALHPDADILISRDFGENPLITACLICGEHRAPINLLHPEDDPICRPCNSDQIEYLRTMINPAALHAKLDAIFIAA
jgi:hypothetical protein